MLLKDRGTRAGYLDPVILADIVEGVVAQVNIAGVGSGVEIPVIIAPGTLWIPSDFYLEISRGNVAGMKIFSIPGQSDEISQTALEDITQIPATTILPNPGGIQLELVSSSALDTAAGANVQSVDVHYLDTTGVEQEETISTAGLVPVVTSATDIDIIQWMHTRAIGTPGQVAAGNISLRDVGGGTVYEYIQAGGNQSLTCRYTVPTGKTGFLLGWAASAITKEIDFRLRATVERFDRSLIPDVFLFQDAIVLQDAPSSWRPFRGPNKIPETGVVKASGISTAAGGNGATSFDILLIDE